jgi:cell division protein FtsQ
MTVSVAADRRFRRAHVRPGRRRSWRSSWGALLRSAVLIAAAGGGGYYGVERALSTDLLAVSQIEIRGNARLDVDEVLALLEGLHGANLLTVDLHHWREALLRSPWIADAVLRRSFPGTISVVVREREPIGIARIGPSLHLVDDRGAIIDQFGPTHADLDLPLIDGLGGDVPAGQSQLDGARAALAARLVAHLRRRPDLAGRISQIDVTDPRSAVLLLKGDATLLRVGDDEFVARLDSYLDLLPALRERVPRIDYVDLRFDDRVYVGPQEPGSRNR